MTNPFVPTRLTAVFFVGILTLCSGLSVAGAEGSASNFTTPPNIQLVAKGDQANEAGEETEVNNSDLNAEQFYNVLSGFMLANNGAPSLGYENILRAAKATEEQQLYEYAVSLGWATQSPERAIRATKSWLKSQPDSIEAAKTLVSLHIATKDYDGTVRPLRKLLSAIPTEKVAPVFLFVTRYYEDAAANQETDAAKAFAKAIRPYTGKKNSTRNRAAALAATARLYWLAGEEDKAVDTLQTAQEVSPNSDHVALVAMEMAGQGSGAASTILRLYMRDNPNVPADIGVRYARVLATNKQNRLALQQLKTVLRAHPKNTDAWLLQAAVLEDEGNNTAAEKSAKKFLALAKAANTADNPTANSSSVEDLPEEFTGRSASENGLPVDASQIMRGQLLLATIAEKQGNYSEAERWLSEIQQQGGKPNLLAEQRAILLAKQNKLGEAQALLNTLPEQTLEEKIGKLGAEINLYVAAEQNELAYNSSLELIKLLPQDTTILYTHSILAERIERHDEMERVLRNIIEIEPENYDAYNALGYSFAERNINLEEAKSLIEKALEISPENPYIMDSLAWVEYKSGNTARAVELLDVVFEQRTDAEIAAHYGEVLYESGRKDEGIAIWREAYAKPEGKENDALKDTMKRYGEL